MNNYETEQKERADSLANEIKTKTSFQDVKVIKGDNGYMDFRVILKYDGIDFDVRKDHRDNILVCRIPYIYYLNISNYKQREARKEIYTSQNMKVITEKKLLEKINEEVIFSNKMEKLQKENTANKFN